MKNILITGARGFIGRNIVENLSNFFKFIEIDLATGYNLLDPHVLDNLVGDFEAIIHLAGVTYIPDSYQKPRYFYDVNFNTTLNAAEFCRKNKIGKFIYLNTYVYGQPQYQPIDELHPVSLPSPYHKSKKLGEDLVTGYFDKSDTKVVVFRLFNIFGKYQEDKFLIPKMVKGAMHDRLIHVMDTAPRRDYIYINDFVDLIHKAVDSTNTDSGIFNVGTGLSVSVQELIDAIKCALGSDIKVINENIRRANEIMDCRANINKVTTTFNWRPKESLVSALEDYIRWCKNV